MQRSRAVATTDSLDSSTAKGEHASTTTVATEAFANAPSWTRSSPFRVGCVGVAGCGSERRERWQLHDGRQWHGRLPAGIAASLRLRQQSEIACFLTDAQQLWATAGLFPFGKSALLSRCSVGFSPEQWQVDGGTNGNNSIAVASQTLMRPAITLDAVQNMVDLKLIGLDTLRSSYRQLIR